MNSVYLSERKREKRGDERFVVADVNELWNYQHCWRFTKGDKLFIFSISFTLSSTPWLSPARFECRKIWMSTHSCIHTLKLMEIIEMFSSSNNTWAAKKEGYRVIKTSFLVRNLTGFWCCWMCSDTVGGSSKKSNQKHWQAEWKFPKKIHFQCDEERWKIYVWIKTIWVECCGWEKRIFVSLPHILSPSLPPRLLSPTQTLHSKCYFRHSFSNDGKSS
jgi:hypothetical protein